MKLYISDYMELFELAKHKHLLTNDRFLNETRNKIFGELSDFILVFKRDEADADVEHMKQLIYQYEN